MQERQWARIASSDEGQSRKRPALKNAVHLCHEPLPVWPQQAMEWLTPTQAGAESSAVNDRGKSTDYKRPTRSGECYSRGGLSMRYIRKQCVFCRPACDAQASQSAGKAICWSVV